MSDITKIKVDGGPESSYQLYPRNEEFAKRAGVNTGSQSGGGSIPKPLTYDYMPEGYPSKSVQTTTLMEEQELAFTSVGNKGLYMAFLTNVLDIVKGQTYTVSWDGTEYECVCVDDAKTYFLGNRSIMIQGDDTGEPFFYGQVESAFLTLDTSASHTISVKRIEKKVTPMEEEFLPVTALITYDLSTNTYSSDFTNDELYARLLDGKHIVFYTTDGNEYLYLTRWKKLSSGTIDLAFAGKNYSVRLNTDGTIVNTPFE